MCVSGKQPLCAQFVVLRSLCFGELSYGHHSFGVLCIQKGALGCPNTFVRAWMRLLSGRVWPQVCIPLLSVERGTRLCGPRTAGCRGGARAAGAMVRAAGRGTARPCQGSATGRAGQAYCGLCLSPGVQLGVRYHAGRIAIPAPELNH